MRLTPAAIMLLACSLALSHLMSAQAAETSPPEVGKKAAGPSAVEQHINQNFQDSMRLLVPLDSEQTDKWHEKYMETQKAIQSKPANLSSASRQVSLQPGAEIPIVRVTPGYVSTLILTDATGAPWPITSHSIGNPEAFTIIRPEGLEPGNLITLSPLTNFAHTNLVITLKDYTYPVTIQLITEPSDKEKRNIETTVVFRADARGPKAERPVIGAPPPEVVDRTMLSFLDGIPPAGARQIRSEPTIRGISIWELKGKLYLRTKLAALWPAWNAVAQGTGGVRVYEMPLVPSLMVSREGEQLSIDLSL